MVILLIIVMIIGFLAFEFISNIYNKKPKEVPVQEPLLVVKKRLTKFNFNDIKIPEDRFFGNSHTWLGLRKTGNVFIGIDDFIAKLIGHIDKISVIPVGAEIKKGEKLITFYKNERPISFFAPVSGVVFSINDNILENPDSIIDDPYNSGWLCAIKPKYLPAEIRLLKIAEESTKWIENEIARLKEFIAGINIEENLIGHTLLDGGEPLTGLIEYLDEASLNKFEKEFLLK